MSGRGLRWFVVPLVLSMVAGGGAFLAYRHLAGGEPGYKHPGLSAKRALVFAELAHLDGPWERQPPPAPGFYFSDRADPGETFDEFRTSGQPVPAGIPLQVTTYGAGPVPDAVMDRVARYGGALISRPVERIPPPADVQDAPDVARGQTFARRVLEVLTDRDAPPGFTPGLQLYITTVELFSGDKEFVHSYRKRRLAIVSVARLGPPGPKRERRLLHIVGDVLGHMVNTQHCAFYRCSLTSSWVMAELDAGGLVPCPVCLRKLQHGYGFALPAYTEGLAAAFRELEYPTEARYVEALAKALGGEPWWR